ncbi:hypothetical protein AK812_SmicGene14816 [Symbiodinium microadriaticum]|uniref:Uncharacterized protein n=1 Tax=Symbiodinium microadriaticum TaxID=2951 RepID=A0A1Q9E4J5_SYMMI|nr:hypothetical protein AK812_SmicGene14816 [Symbiodinium microadriaticum]
MQLLDEGKWLRHWQGSLCQSGSQRNSCRSSLNAACGAVPELHKTTFRSKEGKTNPVSLRSYVSTKTAQRLGEQHCFNPAKISWLSSLEHQVSMHASVAT